MLTKRKIPAADINRQLDNEPNVEYIKQAKKRFAFPFRKKTDNTDDFVIEQGSTTVLDVLSPISIDLTSRDRIEVDGVFHAYLYITGYGYSTVVGNGWLSHLVEAGEGIGLNFIIKRQPKDKILAKVAQTTMVNRSRMRDVGDTRQDYEELDSAINAGLYLKDNMNRNSEDFYYMHTIIEVTADDPETLEYRVSAVETLCVSVDMLAKRCDFKHEQGFLSSLPLLHLDPDIERKSRRNALTTGVAASFPFASFELCDKSGIFLGKNMHNNSACMIDLFDRAKYNNGNIAWFDLLVINNKSTMNNKPIGYRETHQKPDWLPQQEYLYVGAPEPQFIASLEPDAVSVSKTQDPIAAYGMKSIVEIEPMDIVPNDILATDDI